MVREKHLLMIEANFDTDCYYRQNLFFENLKKKKMQTWGLASESDSQCKKCSTFKT